MRTTRKRAREENREQRNDTHAKAHMSGADLCLISTSCFCFPATRYRSATVSSPASLSLRALSLCFCASIAITSSPSRSATPYSSSVAVTVPSASCRGRPCAELSCSCPMFFVPAPLHHIPPPS
ncbi:hypothetical protein FIBSPDRAFT_591843 [Athelia psychrophila]|uniref:Uncharacterized protein n=1 Tax=Athelia psychrophila TaxID=1759441 RepID=A0A166H3X2_9AGAM|nr:hypothetical protein FIBSPDRAFT_591843 [Fibularhizoctonia sp. CBS 109695]